MRCNRAARCGDGVGCAASSRRADDYARARQTRPNYYHGIFIAFIIRTSNITFVVVLAEQRCNDWRLSIHVDEQRSRRRRHCLDRSHRHARCSQLRHHHRITAAIILSFLKLKLNPILLILNRPARKSRVLLRLLALASANLSIFK